MGETDGRKIGVVRFELSELIDLDSNAIREQMSRRLVGHGGLVDLDYKVVGHVEDTISIQVSGDQQAEPEGVPEGILEQIAADILGIGTLDARASDDLDFHEVGVRSVRRALEAAYEAGRCGKPGSDDSIRP